MINVLDRLKTVERTTAERFAGAVAVVSRQTIVDAITEIERLRAIVDATQHDDGVIRIDEAARTEVIK